ncbi:hypothetical protein GTW43_05360 [Streptomyces sp. SID5785]|uniref:hypothetical protein n=1 Tax=Streptomyces sp. SID5785 TaxID=2690309 RepID=UPI001360CD2D|nr:hypothetical protein [Streptomyces sp. SID5785]MZD04510.1 hypothetical protein [Streptomyces sp. SID5785]
MDHIPAGPSDPPHPVRFWSAVAAVLFLPAALGALVLTLMSERAGRCLTYGENCGWSLPNQLFVGALVLGVVALVVVQAAPGDRVRRWAFGVQLGMEGTALVTILSHL